MYIDLDAPTRLLINTSLVSGFSGAGKTYFAATFPRVAWLGSRREEGEETIRWMDRDAWYEPKVKPLAFSVETIAELNYHLNRDILPRVQKGVIKTIALEVSFYSDDIIQSLPDDANGWVKYGTLEKHIMWLDKLAKRTPGLRIHYNAVAQDPSDKKSAATMQVAGKAVARKLPALCSLVGYLRTEDKETGNVERVLHLNTYGPFMARHRYGRRLPNVIRNPTFKVLEGLLSGKYVMEEDGYWRDASKKPTVVQVPGLPPLKAV
jgi:hypothetical protein